MKRRARILCAFGSIELVVSALVLFIFEHTPSPWGVGTAGGGLGSVTDDSVERTFEWQAHALTSIVGAGVVGLAFVLASGAIFLISKLRIKTAD